jgi:hypothetical protein
MKETVESIIEGSKCPIWIWVIFLCLLLFASLYALAWVAYVLYLPFNGASQLLAGHLTRPEEMLKHYMGQDTWVRIMVVGLKKTYEINVATWPEEIEL